ncbi:CHAT domain-containing protein [Nonomuraea sp. NPDC049709]|uniref:CHAT domain-containing protein n=1 Tax=Nonomuraea sp. NPDC049709 TaxID=3154736 RepID=UPI0034350A90
MRRIYLEFDIGRQVPPTVLMKLREPPTSGLFQFECTGLEPEFAALRSAGMNPTAVSAAGQILFEHLNKHESIRAELARALGIDRSESFPIYVDVSNIEAKALPWEALFSPDREFLALDPRWPVGRIIPGRRPVSPPWTLDRPLRVAAILSCLGVPAMDEYLALVEGLNKVRGTYELRLFISENELWSEIEPDLPPSVSLFKVPQDHGELRERIREFRPHVLHLFCHGSAVGTPHLEVAVSSDWSNPDEGSRHRLETREIADLIDVPLCLPWLVVLNACESAVTLDPGPGSGSIAESLVHEWSVPAVIGMRESVLGANAARFTRQFYASLAATLAPALSGPVRSLHIDWAGLVVAAREELCRKPTAGPVSVVAGGAKEWTLPAVHVLPHMFHLNVGDPPPSRQPQLEAAVVEMLLAAVGDSMPLATLRDFLRHRDERLAETLTEPHGRRAPARSEPDGRLAERHTEPDDGR